MELGLNLRRAFVCISLRQNIDVFAIYRRINGFVPIGALALGCILHHLPGTSSIAPAAPSENSEGRCIRDFISIEFPGFTRQAFVQEPEISTLCPTQQGWPRHLNRGSDLAKGEGLFCHMRVPTLP